MRLIAELKEEKDAFTLQSCLKKEQIHSCYDYIPSRQLYMFWILEEDDFTKAHEIYLKWKESPQDIHFVIKEPTKPRQGLNQGTKLFQKEFKVEFNTKNSRNSFSVTSIFAMVCFFVYVINSFQFYQTTKTPLPLFSQTTITPIEKLLLFDYSLRSREEDKILQEYPVHSLIDFKNLPLDRQLLFQQTQEIPSWQGVYPLILKKQWDSYRQLPPKTLFYSIHNGEIWRLLSPVFFHNGLLHLLFNLSWLLSLGSQLEDRLGKGRFAILSCIIGIIANVAQYLISGPFFVGYSGIIVGMVGFIWIRQKLAPWESYPLHPSVIKVVAIFVFAMLGIELFSAALQQFHFPILLGNIANTNHIIGGLTGIFLACLPCFKQKKL